MWFDSHSHIHDEDFAADRLAVLQRAKAAGVEAVLLPGSTLADSRAAVALVHELLVSEEAAHLPELYVAVGVHPHESSGWEENTAAQLKELVLQGQQAGARLKRPATVVAIGEVGLDYHYMLSPKDVQKKVFRLQLELADELDLPVIIHTREAAADTLEILRQAKADGLLRCDSNNPSLHPAGVIHCYSGSAEMVPDFLALGFMLGFDGPITFKKAKVPKRALAATPLDRLVLETDAPYLTPTPHRGKRNEPSYLPLIGEEAALLHGITVAEMAAATTANAKRLYRL